MHKFSRTDIIVSICAVAIAAGAFYFGFHRRQPAAPAAVPNASSMLDWNALLPQVQTVLSAAFPGAQVGSRSAISVAETGDVTGDGVPEAFIDMGYGGASTDELALVGYANGAISVLSYKDADSDPAAPIDFPQGAAVLHADDVGMDATDNAIYTTELTYKTADDSLDTCTLAAYKWNASAGDFEPAVDVGARLQKTYCASVAAGNAQPGE